jgi:hypothetical protein
MTGTWSKARVRKKQCSIELLTRGIRLLLPCSCPSPSYISRNTWSNYMSLSVFLLGGGGEKPEKASKKGKQKAAAIALDDGLDALFKSSVRVS